MDELLWALANADQALSGPGRRLTRLMARIGPGDEAPIAPATLAWALPLALLVLATLTLFLERKLIGIAQKRLGASFLGRNGWAHLPADLVKFWMKFGSRFVSSWTWGGLAFSGSLLAFLVWNLAGSIFMAPAAGLPLFDQAELMIPAYFVYANITTIFLASLVIASRSKYAVLAGLRLALMSIFFEFFFGALYLCLYYLWGGYAHGEAAALSGLAPLWSLAPPLALFVLIYALFEAKRAPFDHAEAESELVIGHLVELGGRSLLFFYLSEYVHVFLCLFWVGFFVFGPSLPLAPYLWCKPLAATWAW